MEKNKILVRLNSSANSTFEEETAIYESIRRKINEYGWVIQAFESCGVLHDFLVFKVSGVTSVEEKHRKAIADLGANLRVDSWWDGEKQEVEAQISIPKRKNGKLAEIKRSAKEEIQERQNSPETPATTGILRRRVAMAPELTVITEETPKKGDAGSTGVMRKGNIMTIVAASIFFLWLVSSYFGGGRKTDSFGSVQESSDGIYRAM